MTDSASYDDSYEACCDDNLSTTRRTITPSIIHKTDADGNTVLHKASAKVHIGIVHLLLIDTTYKDPLISVFKAN